MHNFFIQLHLLIKQKKLLFASSFIFIFVGIVFIASKINFEEDITHILPKSERTSITSKVLQQVNFSDKIIVLFEKKSDTISVNELTAQAQVFLDSLHSCEDYIKNVQGVVNDENIEETFDFVYDNLPLFLNQNDYDEIDNSISRDSIKQKTINNYRALISPSGIVTRDFILKDPLGITFKGLKKLQQLSIGDDFKLVNGFLVTKDESNLLLFINPKLPGSETEKNKDFVDKLTLIQNKLNEKNPSLSVNYFGSTFIAVANAKQIKNDIITTVVISMSILMLFLIYYYRKFYLPIIVFVPTLLGGIVAIAFMALYKHSVSAISLSIGAILLGVTLDYSLHILTHLKKNPDLNKLYKELTQPTLMSSFTTAISFLCLLFVNSDVLKDLGVFAAVSVVFASFFALIFIPIFYKPKLNDNTNITFIDKLGKFSYHKNKVLISFSIILIIFSLFTFKKVKYNNNIGDLNYIPTEIKAVENKIEKVTSLTSKSIYLISYGENIEKALTVNNTIFNDLQKLKASNEILNFSSIGNLILSDSIQNERINKWNSFWATEDKNKTVKSLLVSESADLGFKEETFNNFYTLLDKKFNSLKIDDYEQLQIINQDEFINEKDNLVTIVNVIKIKDEKQRANLFAYFKNKKCLLIDRQQINETFLGNLKNDFNELINYSLIAIFLVLLISFRRLELALLSSIPIVVTGIVIGGLMFLFGLQLNIFSTIVCTLIFGIGVDFSIFMTTALQQKYTTGVNNLPSFRTSMLLAAITTIASIGTLIFAKHPALKSISAVALIGVFAALLITFVFYPILFKIFISNRPKKGNSPITIKLFIHSSISFIYYGFGGILFSFIGKLVLALIPFKKEKKIDVFKKFIAAYMKSVLYSNPSVKKQVINSYNESFEKPAVVIANHTSFLDTLAVAMANYKIVFLVNDWVYNSLVFGNIVKLAGYYPVSKGVEGSVDHLKDKVDQGYSLVVFPEGTRSKDNSVKRFHKGAFYLAEQLQLDIVPIYIHGNSETLPKGDHIIYDHSSITVEVGKRIFFDDITFGENYSQRTKSINKYYRQEFSKIRQKIEHENYFNNKIILSYLYKEGNLQSLIKKDLKKNAKSYFDIKEFLIDDKKVLHYSNDYGQLDFYLALFDSNKVIVSKQFENEKKLIAQNNYLATIRNISYEDEVNLTNEEALLISNNELESIEITNSVNKIITFNVSQNLNQFIEESGFYIKETKEKITLFYKK